MDEVAETRLHSDAVIRNSFVKESVPGHWIFSRRVASSLTVAGDTDVGNARATSTHDFNHEFIDSLTHVPAKRVQ